MTASATHYVPAHPGGEVHTRLRLDGRRLAPDDGLLGARGILLWADVDERVEVDGHALDVARGPAQVVEAAAVPAGLGDGAPAIAPAGILATPLQAGPVFLGRRVAALTGRAGIVVWWEHTGGPRAVLRARVHLAGRASGAIAFANGEARLAPELLPNGGWRFRLYPGAPALTFWAAGAVFVERPLWVGVRYGGGHGEEDLPSPGFFFSILRREGAVARVVAVADDAPAPEIAAGPGPGGAGAGAGASASTGAGTGTLGVENEGSR